MKGKLCKLWAGDSLPVNKIFMAAFGYKAAIIMAVLLQEMQERGNNFAISHEKIREMTGISYYMQKKILQFLEKQGFVSMEKRGIPFRRYYKVNENILAQWLQRNGVRIKEETRRRRKTETEREAEMRAEMDPETLTFYDKIRDDWKKWKQYRKDLRKNYKSSISEKIAVQKLMKYAEGKPETAAKIIERSIERGWLGLFPLPAKEDRPKQKEPKHWDRRKEFPVPPHVKEAIKRLNSKYDKEGAF